MTISEEMIAICQAAVTTSLPSDATQPAHMKNVKISVIYWRMRHVHKSRKTLRKVPNLNTSSSTRQWPRTRNILKYAIDINEFRENCKLQSASRQTKSIMITYRLFLTKSKPEICNHTIAMIAETFQILALYMIARWQLGSSSEAVLNCLATWTIQCA